MSWVFWRLALATCSRLYSVTKITCFAHISQFLNIFSFSLEHFWLFIVFPISNLSKTHRVTLEEPPFLHLFNFKSPRKRYWFFYPQSIFHVFSEMLLEFCVLWISYMGLFLLLALGVWVLLIFPIRCLLCLICLSILPNLCWLVNFIPIWYVFGFSVIYSECEYGCFRMILLIDF